MKQIILAVATCMTMTLVAVAQEIEYTGVRIFDPAVRSLQVAPESNPYLPPVIVMGSDDRINVSFDYYLALTRHSFRGLIFEH